MLASELGHGASPRVRGRAAVMSALPELLTAREVAAWLKTSRKAIYTMVERGQLPGVVRVGKRLLFCRETLLRWTREGPALSHRESER